MRNQKPRDLSRIRTRRALFGQAGVTEIEIARLLGITKGYVSNVVNDRYEGYAVKACITHRLGVGHSAMWGAPCKPPSERQAAVLREKIGLEWTGNPEKPFRLVKK